ncbi:TetR family transcriptional regulator [Mycobacterium sp. IS-1496]|uniref:TetR/AcrR family transcriptional regulator n=1 Tax=Mycobacterium sp. IS-1496 TaxID=1772284 RepID=UPI0007415F0E|nr:TetR/AcrR family transcriptional regulator [Mycobacterium sp. IS-1496]KUI26170.1 TetR family transcriptional regulator [Mycobacterium sp. IS-1496]
MTQGRLRKQPVQERSRATIQRILDTASRLLVEVGYDAVAGSPTLLLQESGVSRGSFYSFFETPEKVLEQLAFQCMQDSAVTLVDDLRPGRHAHWNDVIDTLVDFYVGSFKRPLVRELWVCQHLTPPVRTADREWMNNVAAMMLAAFQAFEPMFSRLTVLQCLVAVEILERLFQYAYTEDPDGDPRTIDEIRVVLIQYFTAYSEPDPGPAG